MAQFDVSALADGTLVLDCQADVLAALDTRFVVPLLSADKVQRVERLNPLLPVADGQFVMLPQAAATVSRSELGNVVGSCASDRHVILNALDVLITGN